MTVENSKDMTKDEFGMAPMISETHVIFSVTEKKNGRVFTFKNKDDLNKMKSYYDDMAKASAIFFSWTAANEDKLILLQMGGDIDESVFNKYKDVVSSL